MSHWNKGTVKLEIFFIWFTPEIPEPSTVSEKIDTLKLYSFCFGAAHYFTLKPNAQFSVTKHISPFSHSDLCIPELDT